MGASAKIMDFRRLPSSARTLTRFHTEPKRDVIRMVQGLGASAAVVETPIQHAISAHTEVLFGPFCLFPTQFLLLENGKAVHIGSRALEVLIALLERPGELVTKQELMDRVWPNTFVEPANLTVHISALRRVLRDGHEGNRFIINIPGRGYSFVASVEVISGQDRQSPNHPEIHVR